ncbi:MAG: hypothetical protein J6S63_09440, partial [Atopobiaceae bacterium]|nr:hypothetical protein [Atopobiaceae bacterium]
AARGARREARPEENPLGEHLAAGVPAKINLASAPRPAFPQKSISRGKIPAKVNLARLFPTKVNLASLAK